MGKSKSKASRQNKHRFWRNAGIVGGVTVTVLVILGFSTGFFTISGGPPPTTEEFSVSLVHGETGDALDHDNFNWTLYYSDDLTDSLELEEITSDDDMDSLTEADFDEEAEEHDYIVVCVEGQDDYDDDDYDEAFYQRWEVLNIDGPNVIEMFENFTSVGAIAIDADAGTALSVNFTSPTNLSLVIMGNQTETDASFRLQQNYEDADTQQIEIIFTFNTTVQKAYLDSDDCDKEARSLTTQLVFSLPYLTVDSQMPNFFWDDDAPDDIACESIEVYFGDSLLASAF